MPVAPASASVWQDAQPAVAGLKIVLPSARRGAAAGRWPPPAGPPPAALGCLRSQASNAAGETTWAVWRMTRVAEAAQLGAHDGVGAGLVGVTRKWVVMPGTASIFMPEGRHPEVVQDVLGLDGEA